VSSVPTECFPPPFDEKPGLYVHVPFCARKCPYCGFFSVPKPALIPAFLDALRVEAELYRTAWPDRFDTLYLGGGCPSLLSGPQLDQLLGIVRSAFRFTPEAEVTLEANPEHVTPGAPAAWRAAGINRLSLGAQSFNESDLAWLGRRHGPADVERAVAAARAAGFKDLGLDLIYGLPGRTPDHWPGVLQAALALEPTHVSAYQLTVEPRTLLARRVARGEVVCPGEDEQADLFLITHDLLTGAGYEHYEISSFARRGKRSRHNQKYWRRADYLGLGPAAHSLRAGRRWWNFSSLKQYLAALGAGRRPAAAGEDLTRGQVRLETLMLGLRTADGLDLAAWRREFGGDLPAESAVGRLAAEGLVRIEDGRLKPTPAGMLLADRMPEMLDPGPPTSPKSLK
jgi:putative oxygen-independent coproporphyrinogen III oxidase